MPINISQFDKKLIIYGGKAKFIIESTKQTSNVSHTQTELIILKLLMCSLQNTHFFE